MKLSGKCYLVTGASSGIGLRLVRALLAIPDTRVTAVARGIDTLREIQDSRLTVLSYDIAREENIDPMLGEAFAAMGGVDCVLACAGFAYYEEFAGRDYGHIERIFDTNVIAPLFLLQRTLAKTRGKLSFTVISSALGLFGLSGYALYCSTKFALDGFRDAYRFEPHDRLHFMTVYPIGVATPFWKRIHDDMPLPRPLQRAETVSDRILLGLRKEKHRVFTSRTFHIAWMLNRVIPVFALYQRIHQSKFMSWLSQSRD